MNRLLDVYDVTWQMKEVLKQEITVKNREQVIEQVNQLVEARRKHMEKLAAPYSEAEKVLGKKIILLNDQIEQTMEKIFNVLKSEMKQVKKQKQSNRNYTNPYEHVQTMDGMFLDSKK